MASREAGLIPAHAGKTAARADRAKRRGAHPRSRGENPRERWQEPYPGGSSPLTRGKRHWSAPQRRWRGLIPAHAGKTGHEGSFRGGEGAHPRSRGENRRRLLSRRIGWGSSPLTRGKRRSAFWSASKSGLIPAHAGKTRHPRERPADHGAHPRSRGENNSVAARVLDPHGSSPLTRGKLVVAHWFLLR